MRAYRKVSLFSGRLSHPVTVLWMSLLSFFYFRWLFWSTETGLSVDGIYFGFLLFGCGVYSIYRLVDRRYVIDRALIAHLCLISVAAATIIWSPGKVAGLRELAAMAYVWMFHFFFRNIRQAEAFGVFQAMTSILAALLFLTVLSILAGGLMGTFIFSPDVGEEIGDAAGYFVMPIDLVSVISFLSISLIAAGKRKFYYYLLLAIASLVLILNFSKTYMVATVAAWFVFWAVRSKSVWSALRVLVVPIVCVALLVFTNNPLSRQLLFNPDMTIAEFVADPQLDIYSLNTTGRINIWTYLLTEAFAVNGPWMGAGLGAAREILAHNPFGEAGFAAHSDYARVLADFGVIGVVGYIVLLFSMGRWYAILAMNRANQVLAVMGGAGLMMTVYLFIGGIGYEMLNRPRNILLVYFAILGMAFMLKNNSVPLGSKLNNNALPASCDHA